MSSYENFLQQMTTWLRHRYDLAEVAIWARAEGKHGCELSLADGDSLWLPDLERDEPDTVQILLHLYSRLQEQKDQQAIHNLRRLSVDLFAQKLEATDSDSDLASVDRIGALLSWLHMDSEPGLRDALRDRLWGLIVRKNYLHQRALSSMTDFHVYYRALDMWSSLSYSGASITDEQRRNLRLVWQQEMSQQESSINNESDVHSNRYCQLQFLLLLFNIQLEHDQRFVGEQTLNQLVLRLQKLKHSEREQQRSDLLSLCTRLANSNQPQDWQILEIAWINSTSKDTLRNQLDAITYLSEVMQCLKMTRAIGVLQNLGWRVEKNGLTKTETTDRYAHLEESIIDGGLIAA